MGGQAAVTATIRAKRGESTFAAPAANFGGFSWSKRLRRSQIEAIVLPSLLLFLFFSPPPFFSFFCGAVTRLFSRCSELNFSKI